jgi:hypothetical protein
MLRQWGRHKGYYEVAWQHVKVVQHRLDGPPAVSWGFASRCGRRMVLLFRRPSDDHIIVRAGAQVFDLDLDVNMVETNFRSIVIGSKLVIRNGVGHLTIRNFTPGRPLGIVDPAYDGIDEEADDFLLYLHRQLGATRWVDAMRSRWGSRSDTTG